MLLTLNFFNLSKKNIKKILFFFHENNFNFFLIYLKMRYISFKREIK